MNIKPDNVIQETAKKMGLHKHELYDLFKDKDIEIIKPI